MTQVVGAIIGWVMFVKRRIGFGRGNQARFARTEFEMLVLHPSEQNHINEHLVSAQCTRLALSTFEAERETWVGLKDDWNIR